MGHVLEMGAVATQTAKDGLHKERGLDQPAIHEMRKVVEMAGVIAFEFEPRAIGIPDLQDVLDIRKGVLEHQIAAGFQMLPLPGVLELGEPVQHRV